MACLKIAVAATTLLSLGGLAQASQAQHQLGPDGRLRCGYDQKRVLVDQNSPGSQPSDCDWNSTNPDETYAPTYVYSVPVVVHVIEHTNGDGALSPETIQDQIDVLNEDFRAIPGSLGAPGLDVMVQFHLATVDPNGQPTTGITYSVNDAWHNDEYTTPGYWEVLQWDPLRYLNIYTLNTVGYYGYYWGSPGSIEDGVYLWWRYVGNNDSPTANSDNYGRTATHEVGHYFGLHHTFEGGCSSSGCYSSGDLICDTNPHATETWGCPSSQSSCGSQVPVRNYMNYTDDNCMWEFTEEQARRMRCRIEWYRPDLADIESDCGDNYCVATANSTGAEAFMSGLGTNVLADNDLTITADLMAWNKFGYFIASQTQGFVQPPGSQGNLCLSGSIKRYALNVMNTGPFGSFSMAVDLTAIPGHGAAVAGETWNFQAWFRDSNPSPTSNFTDGYSVLLH